MGGGSTSGYLTFNGGTTTTGITMHGTATVNSNSSVSGNFSIGASYGGAGALNVGGQITSGTVWTAGDMTVSGIVNNTSNDVLDMIVRGTGGSVTADTNTVRRDALVSDNGKLIATNNNEITRNVSISGTGGEVRAGVNNNIGGNVEIRGEGKLQAGTLNDIAGSLTTYDDAKVVGETKAKTATLAGRTVIDDHVTTINDLTVTDTSRVDSNVNLESLTSSVTVVGTDQNDRVRFDGNNDITANGGDVNITDAFFMGALDVVAGVDVNINTGVGLNDTSFHGNATFDAGRDITLNKSAGDDHVDFDGTVSMTATRNIEINTGTGNKSVVYDDEATITAAGDVTINKLDGNDSAIFNDEATISGVNVTINDGGLFKDETTITATENASVTNSDFVKNASVHADQTATLTDVNTSTVTGLDLGLRVDAQDVVIKGSSATLGNRSVYSNDTHVDATSSITVTNTEFNGTGHEFNAGDNIRFENSKIESDTGAGVAAIIKSASGNIVIHGSVVGDYAEITAGGDINIVSNSVIEANSSINATGKLTVSSSTVKDDAAIVTNDGIDWNTDSTIGSSVTVTNSAGDVDITGAVVGDNLKITTAGDGDITIDMTTNSDISTSATNIGNNAQIKTVGTGDITIKGGKYTDLGGDHVVQLEIGTTAGTNAGFIETGAGDVTIEKAAIRGTAVRTTGGANNSWNLNGAYNFIKDGPIDLNGTVDNIVVGSSKADLDYNAAAPSHSYYDTIENNTGSMKVTIEGSHVGSIVNNVSAAAGGDSTYVLKSHDNESVHTPGVLANVDRSGNMAEILKSQVVEHITGNGDGDHLTVSTNARFTEFADYKTNFVQPANVKNNAQNAHVTSITGMDTVDLFNNSGLEIGRRDSAMTGVAFESKTVLVQSASDLFLHRSATANYQHKVDNLEVSGGSTLWIDRTSITGLTGANATTSVSLVGAGSTVLGYRERDAGTGNWAAGTNANIVGSLATSTNTVISPYSVWHYDPDFMTERLCPITGVNKMPLFREAWNDKGEGLSIDGTASIGGGTVFKLRLFTDEETNKTSTIMDYDDLGNGIFDAAGNALNTYTVATNSGDFISVENGGLGLAIDSATNKIETFNPMNPNHTLLAGNTQFTGKAHVTAKTISFGNDNELGAKIGDRTALYDGFKVYNSNDTVNDYTYYYSIVRSDQEIIGYNGSGVLVDPSDPSLGSYAPVGNKIQGNALFDANYMIKSDMLGDWDTMMSEDGKEVLLRFRLLAKHPVQGGIAADMHEPNAEAVARQLDRIRYPFDHSDLHVRYDGDMVSEYEKQYLADPSKYPNYKPGYIEDFEDLMREIQNEIKAGNTLHTAMRKLHPEPYADLASLNLNLMDSFVKTREQHGINSLYQVEVDNYEAAVAEAEARAERRKGSAYASLFDDYCGVEQFVCNPIRIWAAGMGADGKQQRVGTEYGYKTETWGGAVGAVKEFGDLYLGIAGGYAKSNVEWTDLAASAKTDAFMADAVIGLRRGMGFVEAFANYAYNEHSVRRYIDIGGYTGSAHGEYEDDVWGGGIRLGYQALSSSGWLFIPTIGVNYIQTESGEFTEKGNANQATLLQFAKAGIKRKNVRVPITARLNKSFALGCFVLTPEVRASASAILGNKTSKATARFVGDPAHSSQGHFTAVGVKTGRWVAQVGASLELSRKGRFSVSGNYDYTFSNNSHEHNYSLMLGINF